MSDLNYEIVYLEEKKAAGLMARTNNASPDMGEVIGGLWQRFYQDGIHGSIKNKINEKALGIYTDYASNEQGDYSIIVACEVKQTDAAQQGITIKTIPAGKYAKFIVKGHMEKAVAEFWTRLWELDLNRAYICDFEEYQNSDMDNAEIHVYIGLKE